MKTESRTYLTLILPNCYSLEEVQHQALNPLIVKPLIIIIIIIIIINDSIYPAVSKASRTGNNIRRQYSLIHNQQYKKPASDASD